MVLIPYSRSLGEYSALAAVANVLSVEDLVELVFLRGITMQNAVSRDEKGLSSFAMVAANPTRVAPSFTVKDLHNVVDLISLHSGKLLQVVNYNVENWQYIITGYKSNLEALRVVLSTIKENPKKAASLEDVVKNALAQFSDPTEMYSVQQGSKVASLISFFEKSFIGPATIPLPGIDVPFHSKFLLGEVPQFREYLMKTFNPKFIDLELLEGKYIPNLTGYFCFFS